MHILYVHRNFPAQLGHLAIAAAARPGYRCTYASIVPPGRHQGVELIQYQPRGQATQYTHYCSRTFENFVWCSHALFEAVAARPDIRPDLIVAHSGFVSPLFLRELFECPVIGYFEFFYHTRGTDLDFFPDHPPSALNLLRSHTRNAGLLLDLNSCDVGISPTRWQHSLFPEVFRDKIRVLFDGIDMSLWRPLADAPRSIGGRQIPADVRVITYVARGLERMRGFDIFMKVARRLCQLRQDVIFLVVGAAQTIYGGNAGEPEGMSYKDWVLSQSDYDLSRIHFLGMVDPPTLARIFSLSDLHIYLTAPFVLSWSLLDALACGATVLASNTAPVTEVISPGVNGLLADFFDVDGLVEQASKVLDDPDGYRHLGQAAVAGIREQYSMEVCFPKHLRLYEEVVNGRGRQ